MGISARRQRMSDLVRHLETERQVLVAKKEGPSGDTPKAQAGNKKKEKAA